MNLVYRYKLCPSKTQAGVLAEQLETLRRLYNRALAERMHTWETDKRSVSLGEQKKSLITEARKSDEWLARVNVGTAQQALMRLDRAFQAFFRRVKAGGEPPGYPKFRKRRNWRTIIYNSLGNGCRLNLERSRVYLQYAGEVRIDLYRPIPENATAKNLSLTHQADGWWLCVLLEMPDVTTLASALPATGIDVGYGWAFVSTAEGRQYPPERFFAEAEEHLAKLQRIRETLNRGSARYRECNRQIARHHLRVRNRRHHWHIHVANDLLTRYGVIFHEALSVREMVQRPEPKQADDGTYLPTGAEATLMRRKSIVDAAWSEFFSVLALQAAKVGARVVAVDAADTTTTCAECGLQSPVAMSETEFCCRHCAHQEDRKVNAAKNILKRGLDLMASKPL
jgi:putative transposase